MFCIGVYVFDIYLLDNYEKVTLAWFKSALETQKRTLPPFSKPKIDPFSKPVSCSV
jgi:hypothetical protein